MAFIEDKQKICDAFCETLKLTHNAHDLVELRYMFLKNGEEVVRPIFKDGWGSSGYYDVNVSWDSGTAMISDIVKGFVNEVW